MDGEKEKGRIRLERQRYPEGIKWTRQRKDVYDILLNEQEPVSALQIYQQLLLTEEAQNYAVSTVYRILGTFEEKGLVHKDVRNSDHNGVYELERGEHTHYAVCLVCHKRIPLAHCPFSYLQEIPAQTAEGPEDFVVTGHRLELYGYCRECR